MAYGWKIHAMYERPGPNGPIRFAYVENDFDVSPYDPARNCWADIARGTPTEHGHGRLVQLSLIRDVDGLGYTFDLPEGAEPFRLFNAASQVIQGGDFSGWSTDAFGQWMRVGFDMVDEHGSVHTTAVSVPLDAGEVRGQVISRPIEGEPTFRPPEPLPVEVVAEPAEG